MSETIRRLIVAVSCLMLIITSGCSITSFISNNKLVSKRVRRMNDRHVKITREDMTVLEVNKDTPRLPVRTSFINAEEAWGDPDFVVKKGIGKPTVLHLAGGRWESITFDRVFSTNQVLALDQSNIWFLARGAGRTRDADRDLIIRFDGQNWTMWSWNAINSGSSAICMSSPSDGWVVGSHFLHWDGQNWTSVPAPLKSYDSCSAVKPNDVWAAADGGLATGESAGLYHDSEGQWNRYDVPRGTKEFDSISLSRSGKGWAVGEGGLVARFDGEVWTIEKSVTEEDLIQVEAVSDNAAWALGRKGAVLRYNGARWELVKRLTGKNPYTISAISDTEAFVSGNEAKGGKGFVEKVTAR